MGGVSEVRAQEMLSRSTSLTRGEASEPMALTLAERDSLSKASSSQSIGDDTHTVSV